ncbi:hypothetical protein R1flu_021561 [Riccia fluitans]|uniref:Uncharacterized protein n=1 Tax=Riccia fluitans TaxID=41844 RepID=A0ABD1ZPX9_9MARC
MRGYERKYHFGDLLDSAMGLNSLSALEYGEEKLQLDKHHHKQETIWTTSHPLEGGEIAANLSDFSEIGTNTNVVSALQEEDEEEDMQEGSLDDAQASHASTISADLEADCWDPVQNQGVEPTTDVDEDDGVVDDLQVAGHEV